MVMCSFSTNVSALNSGKETHKAWRINAIGVLPLLCCFVLGLMLFCVSCNKHLAKSVLTITKQDGSKVTVQAEMARTKDERAHGFMERKIIDDGTGMLFIFDRDQTLSFWMKNTPHPLSIAYIDSRGVMRDIFDMKPFDLSDVTSTFRARYALEVPQGWYERQGIKAGDTLVIDFDTASK